MTSTPADQLRAGHAAFNERSRDRLLQLLSAKVTWHEPGQSPLAGTHEGRDEVWERFFAPGWEAPLRVEDREILSTDEYAVAVSELVIGDGAEARRWPFIEVVRVVDGELRERWAYTDRQAELDEVFAPAG